MSAVIEQPAAECSTIDFSSRFKYTAVDEINTEEKWIDPMLDRILVKGILNWHICNAAFLIQRIHTTD